MADRAPTTAATEPTARPPATPPATRVLLARLRATLSAWGATKGCAALTHFDAWAMWVLHATGEAAANPGEKAPAPEPYGDLTRALQCALEVSSRVQRATLGLAPRERAAVWAMASAGNELAFAELERLSQARPAR